MDRPSRCEDDPGNRTMCISSAAWFDKGDLSVIFLIHAFIVNRSLSHCVADIEDHVASRGFLGGVRVSGIYLGKSIPRISDMCVVIFRCSAW